MDKEATVETAFSVWGSDEESVLDKGVGGLDPAHSDKNLDNGREKARERPTLIMIAKKGDFGATEKRFLSEQTNSSSVSRKRADNQLKSQPLQMRQPDGKLLKPKKGDIKQGSGDNSQSIPIRRHEKLPNNVEEKRREAYMASIQ